MILLRPFISPKKQTYKLIFFDTVSNEYLERVVLTVLRTKRKVASAAAI